VKSIITAWPTDISTMDPYTASNSEDGELTANVYQGLVTTKFIKRADGAYVKDGDLISPSLASSWTLGKTSATFHLKGGVKFYPSGDPLTAADVKWSLDAALGGPNKQDITTDGLQSAKDVQVINSSTIKLSFENESGTPLPVTPKILAVYANGNSGAIVDATVAERHATAADPWAANWLRTNTAGTGPYYVAKREAGQEIVLQAVPGASPQPAFKTVTIQVVNSASMAGLLRGGSINFAEFNLSQDDLNSLQSAGFTVKSAASQFFDYLALASNTGPLANVNIRKAIADAIPYSEISNSIYFGRASRAYSDVQASAFGYTPAWSMYSENLTQAKADMKAAGNPRVSIGLNYLSTDSTQQDMAILIQHALAGIGIKVTLTPETQTQIFATIDSRSQPTAGTAVGDPEMVLWNWGAWTNDPSIPIGYEATTGGVNNYSLWSNPTVDTLNTKFELAPNTPARAAAYEQMQKTVAAAAPLIPIVTALQSVAMAKGITGENFSGSATRYWMMSPTT
jgi:peptide/nickel transport system substrate-binding protein